MKFLCTACGACCMTAGKLKLMPDRGDGACINLNDLNLCNIYDARPEFCSITDMYYNYNLEEEENITLKQWYIKNTKDCHTLIDHYKLDDKYKVDTEEYENM